jgi:hypothetical protein
MSGTVINRKLIEPAANAWNSYSSLVTRALNFPEPIFLQEMRLADKKLHEHFLEIEVLIRIIEKNNCTRPNPLDHTAKHLRK